MKKENGITLVVLVLTIVVLIILAAVAINLSLGNNGIFNRAKTAKEQWQNAQNEEEMQIAKYSNEIDSYVGGGRAYLNVKSGTYTGNGNTGSTNPNTLEFEETPQIVIICPVDLVDSTYFQSIMLIQGCKYSSINTVANNNGPGNVNIFNAVTWSNDGKKVEWYNNDINAGPQMNCLNSIYKWVAIF